MIAIQRPAVPDFLKHPDNKWEMEIKNAIAHYLNPENKKQYEFKHYSDPLIKEALKKVFPKCAYCESKYAHVYDGDVEHFRPKAKVNEKSPKTPGYYWLANDWDNLLLSCQHCNQSRRHIIYRDNVAKPWGKLDQFPLRDERKRVTSHCQSIEEEESVRLLLHPCKDKPEEHFQYDLENGVISSESPEGKASLMVYALWRPELVERRITVLSLLRRQIERVKIGLDRCNLSQDEKDRKMLSEEWNDLMTFTHRDSEYAGMSRFFVRQFINENKLAQIFKTGTTSNNASPD